MGVKGMKRYTVEIEERLVYELVVEATDDSAATMKALQIWRETNPPVTEPGIRLGVVGVISVTEQEA